MPSALTELLNHMTKAIAFRIGPPIIGTMAVLVWAGAATQARPKSDLDSRFAQTVLPFLQANCTSCHGKEKPQAQLDLTAYTGEATVARDFGRWTLVSEKLAAKQMPPSGTQKQPSAAERASVIGWIRDVRQYETERNGGDPGPILARRLSNAEYDYTIRDLTGADLRPTREFPVDPANQEGFDNSGESLTFSPALMKKYVQAAKEIADHAVLTSDGIRFAAHPVLAETDRDKFCILRIVDFYKRQPTDYADYFQAAWRFRNRAALGSPNATLETIAAQLKVSPRYLNLVWATLNATGERVGPIARLQSMWTSIPAPDRSHPTADRPRFTALRDWVTSLRKRMAWQFDNLRVPRGFDPGGQCFVLWKDREYASHRRMLDPRNLQVDGVPRTRTVRVRRMGNQPAHETTVIDKLEPDLAVPKDEALRSPYIESYNRFCGVFPDAFYIAERGRMFVDDPGDKGRLLTAGLHNSMGYFRDDAPLMELILDENGRRELNRLWLDFDTVAFVPERMHLEFFVYERAEAHTITDPEFNFARAEDKSALSDEKIKLLGDLYEAKARKNGAEPPALQAIEEHFKWVSTTIRATEKARLAAEPAQMTALIDFARRAYRRPLTDSDRSSLLAFYRSLRQHEGLSHEEAIRDSLVSVLMSSSFLFRMDLESAGAPRPPSHVRTATARRPGPGSFPSKGLGVVSLSDYALASRLSYFLWSSMPDEELLSHAAAGDLHRPEVLAAQAKRMIRDPRIRALALEFVGNWLDFRRFEEHNAVDRERFPSFNDSLREAMFEEPLHFLIDEFQANRSVLEMLYGKHTFVNGPLAKHYGMHDLSVSGGDWIRVEDAGRYGRGGLLPMSVFLTRNSPGLRTSPVKRGYWVVRRLLGEYIPPPPATVPALPADESKLGNLTLRQALAAHRENPACAGCHARFDSYGLVFEGYGPTGELRDRDLGGKPVDVRAPFAGGERAGVAGLQEFIRERRQNDFLDTLCRKLLSYGLGRTLMPSDDLILVEMKPKLTASGYRFGSLVDTIVTSPQFRNRRVPDTVASK